MTTKSKRDELRELAKAWAAIIVEGLFGGKPKTTDERLAVAILAILDELDAKDAELDEQCRINGMGAQRELKLMTEVRAKEAALKDARETINSSKQSMIWACNAFALHDECLLAEAHKKCSAWLAKYPGE